VLTTLKHFAGHSFSEGGRNHAPVRVGERELVDTFLLPFEMTVKLAHAGFVMPAYHDIDGEPLSSSRRFVTGILREQWGVRRHHRLGLRSDQAPVRAPQCGTGRGGSLRADPGGGN